MIGALKRQVKLFQRLHFRPETPSMACATIASPGGPPAALGLPEDLTFPCPR